MTAAQVIRAKIAKIGIELAYRESRLEQRISNFKADAEESGTTRIALFLRNQLDSVTNLYHECEAMKREKHLLEIVLQEVEEKEGQDAHCEKLEPLSSYFIPVQNAYGLLLGVANETHDGRVEEALKALEMVLF